MRAMAVAVLLIGPAVASAHRMDVAVVVGPGGLTVTVRYEDETPADGATVTLSSGAVGTTDERGVCVLPRPAAGTYTLTAADGVGHRATLEVAVPESEDEIATVATAKRNRWLMALAGLALIGGGAMVAKWMGQRRGVQG